METCNTVKTHITETTQQEDVYPMTRYLNVGLWVCFVAFVTQFSGKELHAGKITPLTSFSGNQFHCFPVGPFTNMV